MYQLQKQPPEVFYEKRSDACNFFKKETLAQVFSCEFCEIFKNTCFTELLWTTDSAIASSDLVLIFFFFDVQHLVYPSQQLFFNEREMLFKFRVHFLFVL